MDPLFNDVRNTATLHYWILELVLENLWTLENLSERLNRNLLVLQNTSLGQSTSSYYNKAYYIDIDIDRKPRRLQCYLPL